MRRLFLLLQQVDVPAVLAPEASADWGDEAVGALERAGVVQRVAADWYPCGGPHGSGCPRRVRANPGDAKRPLLAVCGRAPAACLSVPLAAGEREQLVASLPALGRAARSLLGLGGELVAGDPSMPDTLHLGHLPREGGAPVDVLLTRAAWNAGFGGMLAERRALPRPTLVLAPTATYVRSDLVARYAGPGRVRLAFAEDLLAVRAGKLVLARGAGGLAAPAPGGPVCRALTERGERAVDRATYDAMRAAEPPPFDLLLDLLRVAHGQPAAAWRRDAGGHAERVELTRHEAEALAELIERRAPIAACELVCLRAAGVHDPVRIVERARRKVDVRVSRYAWRAFATSGGSGRARVFHFAPPAGFRYACFVRLPGGHADGLPHGPSLEGLPPSHGRKEAPPVTIFLEARRCEGLPPERERCKSSRKPPSCRDAFRRRRDRARVARAVARGESDGGLCNSAKPDSGRQLSPGFLVDWPARRPDARAPRTQFAVDVRTARRLRSDAPTAGRD